VSNRQPTIKGMRCSRGLVTLRPALHKWIELNRRLADRWVKRDHDVPWWYNERALLGLFSTAIWLSGGVSLEEYSDAKRALSKKGRPTEASYTGRTDLYFETKNKQSCAFRAESKRYGLAATTMKDQRQKLRERFKHVRRDIGQAPSEKEMRRLALLFVAPRITCRHSANIGKAVKWSIDQASDLRPDAMAWVFPKIGKYGCWEKYQFPGVLILIKEVKRA
jgi:hypothetical protein